MTPDHPGHVVTVSLAEAAHAFGGDLAATRRYLRYLQHTGRLRLGADGTIVEFPTTDDTADDST